jgi:hypothetical protein
MVAHDVFMVKPSETAMKFPKITGLKNTGKRLQFAIENHHF